ncbi:putative 26S proteasome regulatory subunit [Coemansia spiralis]|uniref:26S proteasome regulatory subunit n=2 Tax=Coemansia TaxID=4863 RepID=A0ABQ8PFJ2_9FUNG|nr:26S proteasome non-ATPase regulatory subunit 9-like protein [Coemansia spiralis]KAJ1986184.1 putative 26S proteasome regulatory subunit [Coemansia umbellata]KAJ2618662.1 putative 26S proteasome regulatory subunit [Coemansia sp. RSA 1358]KAJ2668674.1 putative 26S proteasome regulatory subunit [Coemansia spiralis]
MERAQALLKQKDNLENEIRDLELELQSHGVTKTEALVDADGFPRADIDIVAIRGIRRSLIYKQNDLKDLVKQIEESLVNLHQNIRADEEDEPEVKPSRQRPFARVNMVTPNSPASEAGLVVGDKIVQYGSVNTDNHNNLKLLISETTDSIGKPIIVIVDRVLDGQPQSKTLKLTPRRNWGGDGLLGCYILPL